MKIMLLFQLLLLGSFLFFAAYSQGLILNRNPDELGIIVIQVIYPFIIFPICYFLCKKQELIEVARNKASSLNITLIISFLYIIGLYMALTLTARVSYMEHAAYAFNFIIAVILFLLVAALISNTPWFQPCSYNIEINESKLKSVKKLRGFAVLYIILSFITLIISTNVFSFVQEVVVHCVDILTVVLILLSLFKLNARTTQKS